MSPRVKPSTRFAPFGENLFLTTSAVVGSALSAARRMRTETMTRTSAASTWENLVAP